MSTSRGSAGAALTILMTVFILAGLAPGRAALAADVSVTVDTDILDPVGAVVEKAVDPVLREVVRAREAIEEMKRIGEDAEKIAAAVKNLETLEIKLEGVRIKAAARTSGLTEEEILALRRQGKGWGVIAKEMGLHPGVLGVGHGSPLSPKSTVKPGKAKKKTWKQKKKKGKKK